MMCACIHPVKKNHILDHLLLQGSLWRWHQSSLLGCKFHSYVWEWCTTSHCDVWKSQKEFEKSYMERLTFHHSSFVTIIIPAVWEQKPPLLQLAVLSPTVSAPQNFGSFNFTFLLLSTMRQRDTSCKTEMNKASASSETGEGSQNSHKWHTEHRNLRICRTWSAHPITYVRPTWQFF